MATRSRETIEVENVIRPGTTRSVDAGMYQAMRKAFLKVLPRKAPGLTAEEIRARVLEILPESRFPGGAKAGWWHKTVQLDLEAKGVVAREKGSPLRWHRT